MVIQDKHNPTVINYVALLGPRDEAPFINVPQTSVVVPHYLMYSILGRADLIRFEVSVEKAQKQ